MCHTYCAVLVTILVLLLNKFHLIWFDLIWNARFDWLNDLKMYCILFQSGQHTQIIISNHQYVNLFTYNMQHTQAHLEPEVRVVARWRRLWDKGVKEKWFQATREWTDGWDVSKAFINLQFEYDMTIPRRIWLRRKWPKLRYAFNSTAIWLQYDHDYYEKLTCSFFACIESEAGLCDTS